MKTIFIAKANPISPSGTIESITISISETIPEVKGTGKEYYFKTQKFFKSQAVMLCNELFKTLPGGMIDQLLGEMLSRKASCYMVPFRKRKNK